MGGGERKVARHDFAADFGAAWCRQCGRLRGSRRCARRAMARRRRRVVGGRPLAAVAVRPARISDQRISDQRQAGSKKKVHDTMMKTPPHSRFREIYLPTYYYLALNPSKD